MAFTDGSVLLKAEMIDDEMSSEYTVIIGLEVGLLYKSNLNTGLILTLSHMGVDFRSPPIEQITPAFERKGS